MSLSKAHYPLLRTGSTQEDPSKIVSWDVKNQNKQTNGGCLLHGIIYIAWIYQEKNS